MTNEQLCDFLGQIPFFATLQERDWRLLQRSKSLRCQTFSANERISDVLHGADAIAVLLSGNATVHNAEGDQACLRVLSPASVFGVAALFARTEQPISTIVAKSACEICFLPASLVEKWLHQNSDFSMQYIRFLSDRIRFLNGRITAFTASCATEKLRNHLYELCGGHYPTTLTLNAARLATMLGIGRASLYRAFDALEKENKIIKNGKSVTVLSL